MRKASFFGKAFVALFGSALLLTSISCKQVGVGEAIDLEAPMISIDWPSNNAYVQQSFEISGTASDNREITDIEIQYTYRNSEGEKITETKHTNTQNKKNGKWSYLLEFPFDQEVTITVYARDRLKNESMNSSDSVFVIIDSEAPKSGAMQITRNNGFTTTTSSIEKFIGEDGREAKRNTDSANKDYFQNESFTLSCNVTETYEIDTVYLNLYEIENYVSASDYTKTTIKENIPVDENEGVTNLYNPEFTLTQETLVSYKNSLASGVHYIMPEVVVIDKATNISKPLESKVPIVFAWEVEYDTPKATLPLYYEEGLLKFAEGTTVPVVIFDDDGLKSYSYELKNNESGKVKTGSEDISAKNLRDHSFEIKTNYFDGGETDENKIPDGNYTLSITVEDQLTSATGGGIRQPEKLEWKDIPVKITNADAPTINVSKPDFNSTPELIENTTTFELKGESLDNGEVKDIAIAWCRNGESDEAIKYFEKKFDFSAAKSKTNKTIPPGKDFVIWNIGKDAADSEKIGNQYKDAFSKTFDIYTDFVDASGNIINDVKVFVIAAKDLTDNVSTEVWRVGAINSLPKFKIETSDNNSDWTEQTQTIISATPNKKLYVRIKPESDLEISEFNVDGENASIDGQVITIEAAKAVSGEKREIKYYAKDKLGNRSPQQGENLFTVRFSEIPAINDIVCNQEGTKIKSGDLKVQVIFDRPVTVTGTPKLLLDCYKNKDQSEKTGSLELAYETGSKSATLTFKATIPSPVEYKSIAVNHNSGTWINLNGGTIKSGDGIEADLAKYSGSGKFNITIDNTPPTLTSYGGGTGKNYAKSGGAVEITLNFSEPVTAQNGNITIYRTGSEDVSGSHTWHIPAVIEEKYFEKIWNNSTAANREVLCGSSTAMMIAGPDAYGEPSLVAKGPYKMYTNGLVESGGVMVPDLTTKYVLDWDYNTSGNETNTAALRAALEAVKYHKTTIPLSRLNLKDSNSATLTISDDDFIGGLREGVEYVMIIPEGAVSDELQNKSGAIANYTFSVGNTATPVIRVNRWSTNSNDNIAPTGETAGKARVKIDCETPGATIKYRTLVSTANGAGATTAGNTVKYFHPASKSETEINTATEQSYNTSFSVGDGFDYTGQRIYMSAYATSTIANMQNSSNAYECAYKTVLKYVNTRAQRTRDPNINRTYTGEMLKILACQTADGVSWIAGWPLTMRQHWHQTTTAELTRDGYKLAYRNSYNKDSSKENEWTSEYTWISWELVYDKEFTTLVNGENFQKSANTICQSGDYIYGYEVQTYPPM